MLKVGEKVYIRIPFDGISDEVQVTIAKIHSQNSYVADVTGNDYHGVEHRGEYFKDIPKKEFNDEEGID